MNRRTFLVAMVPASRPAEVTQEELLRVVAEFFEPKRFAAAMTSVLRAELKWQPPAAFFPSPRGSLQGMALTYGVMVRTAGPLSDARASA